MTYTKIQKVIDKYLTELSAHIIEKDSVCQLCHVKWMLTEMSNWGQNMAHWDKLNRWLGFIQGVFWCEDIYTIEEVREHNRTEEVETAPYFPKTSYNKVLRLRRHFSPWSSR